jgi:hypothetical protein
LQQSDKCPSFPSLYTNALEIANIAFTFIFMAELVLKLLAEGVYHKDFENGECLLFFHFCGRSSLQQISTRCKYKIYDE